MFQALYTNKQRYLFNYTIMVLFVNIWCINLFFFKFMLTFTLIVLLLPHYYFCFAQIFYFEIGRFFFCRPTCFG